MAVSSPSQSFQEPSWLASVIQVARSGYVSPALLLLSITSIATFQLQSPSCRVAVQQSNTNPDGSRPSSSPELLGHVSRTVAFAYTIYAALQDQQHLSNAVLMGYIVLLGFSRLAVSSSYWRHVLLIHVNYLSLALLLVVSSGELLPLALKASVHESVPGILGLLVSLSAAVLCAATSPRESNPPPFNDKSARQISASASQEETCSWLDYYLTFSRLTPLIWTCSRNKSIGLADLPDMPWYQSTDRLLAKLRDARLKKSRTLWTLVYFARVQIAATAFYAAVLYASNLGPPYCLYKILEYLENPDDAKLHPWTWVVMAFAASMVRLFSSQQHSFTLSRLNMRLKSSLTAEMYERVLASRDLEDDFLGSGSGPGGSQPTAAGQLANLISTDITSITFASHAIIVVVGVPITVIFAIIGLYQIVGWTSLVGLLIIVICFPLPTWIVRNVGEEQEKAQHSQDSRISLASEYLTAIRFIKYFAWEDAMKDYINKVRAEEQRHLWRVDVLYALMGEATEFIPVLSLLTIFTLQVAVLGKPLSAPVAFTVVTLVKMIKTNLYLLGVISPRLTRASISLARIDKFFDATTPLQLQDSGPLGVHQATFRRSGKVPFSLEDISIDFVQGGLNIVTGASGSGKTTLLLGLLGEAECQAGQVTRPRDVAYASQTPWLQALSIRDNILFGQPYDVQRYHDVIHASCLSFDLNELAAGDQTMVGESGTSLSGGQRARVAVARALYSDASVLLLDDVFSALDIKTVSQIWNRVFCGEFLKDKTVVLVSQVPWMFSNADLLITLASGKIYTIRHNVGIVRKAIKEPDAHMDDQAPENKMPLHNTFNDSAKDAVPPTDYPATGEKPSDSTAIDEEAASSGAKGRLMFLNYMLYFGGPGMVLVTVFALVVLNAFMIVTPWWLSYWVDSISRDDAANMTLYLGIYVAINIASTIAHGVAIVAVSRGAWAAARRLHNELVSAVMDAPLSWYKTTPVGRIINRLSMDIGTLDGSLGHQVRGFLDELIRLIFQVGAVTSTFPVFFLPSTIATAIGFICGEMYSRTAVIVHRLLSASQSPILSHFSETLSGAAVVRAQANMPKLFLDSMADHLHRYAKVAAAHKDLDCWLQFRIDFLSALVNTAVSLMAINKVRVMAAGVAGFSLTNATGLSRSILNIVGIMNDMDIDLQSFQRVEEYCKMPPEESIIDSDTDSQYSDDVCKSIPASWPSTGRVEFRNVTVRYDDDGPDILKDINLTFDAGKRSAIVGRTGSGKSTLVLSLLRLTNIVSGQIFLDGVDITTMSRKRLRRAISAIPQEATLFQGTVGFNLDPLERIPENDLATALDLCTSASSSFGIGANSSADKLTLTSPVQSGGANFSHGQRQIISLCRTLARNSKLMLLDEATASMDSASDTVIQDVLKGQVSGAAADGRCLVTIAHRLRTIADYDQVVVMGSGRVLEVGVPQELFHQKGEFHKMVMVSQESDTISAFGQAAQHT